MVRPVLDRGERKVEKVLAGLTLWEKMLVSIVMGRFLSGSARNQRRMKRCVAGTCHPTKTAPNAAPRPSTVR